MKKAQKKLTEIYKTKDINSKLKYYDTWDTYEEDLMSLGFFGPVACTALLFKYIKSDAKIFDVGCGPGNLGNYLKLLNFKNIYGLDGSQGMIERAKQRKIYKKIYHQIIGTDPLPILNVDVLVASGVFSMGLPFPQGAMKVCFNSVRPGGYFCFSAPDKILKTVFKEEFNFIKSHSELIDSTSSQILVPHAEASDQQLAKVYLFRKK
ncbi:MAG: class I SAM-dependent methyltransferase [Polynucleobacter sp.]